MTVYAVTFAQKRTGGSKARCVCDTCGAEMFVTCNYDNGVPNPSQVNLKMANAGWRISKKEHTCEACEAKRKETNTVTAKTTKPTTAPKQPTRKQKRDIVDAISAVWDDKAERYGGGYTDKRIAQELSDTNNQIMPGWVVQIRTELFGENAGNEDADKFLAKLDQLAYELETLRQEFGKLSQTFDLRVGGAKK